MAIPKGGMYGAAILSVLIAVAIFITVASDVEKTEYEVTKYNYVTDTTGLFEQDKSPQYYDYDLSQSYTGYYTADTEPYFGGTSAVSTAGQTVYYGMDEVIKPGSVNGYRLNFAPDIAGVANDIHTAGVPSDYQYATVAVYGLNGTETPTSGSGYWNAWWDGFKVQNFVSNLESSSDGVGVEPLYKMEGDTLTGTIAYYYNYVDSLPPEQTFDAKKCKFIKIESLVGTITGSILIASTDDFKHYGYGGNGFRAVAYCEQDYYNYLKEQSIIPTWTEYSTTGEAFDTNNCQVAAHSCIVNMVSGKVDLYAGYFINDNDVPIRTIELDKAILITNGSTGSSYQYRLGIMQNVNFYNEVYVYMDTSRGVEILSQGS